MRIIGRSGRRPKKSFSATSSPHRSLVRDLRYTARELRETLNAISGLIDDLDAQARRVARLGK